jgi:hypothetical protein
MVTVVSLRRWRLRVDQLVADNLNIAHTFGVSIIILNLIGSVSRAEVWPGMGTDVPGHFCYGLRSRDFEKFLNAVVS